MHRREYLSASGFVISGLLAGCLTEDNGGRTEPDGDTEDGNDDWPSFFGLGIDDTFDTGEGVRFSTRLVDGITVARGRGSLAAERPGLVDLSIKNIAKESLTVEFDGFVPFPNPRAEIDHDGEEYELLVLPERDAETNFDVNHGAPEYERIEEYWEVTEPVERPDGTTSIPLEPTESITVGHDIVAATGHLENSPTGGPYVGSYPFESSVTVARPDGGQSTVTMGFTVDVSYFAE